MVAHTYNPSMLRLRKEDLSSGQGGFYPELRASTEYRNAAHLRDKKISNLKEERLCIKMYSRRHRSQQCVEFLVCSESY